MNSFQTAKNSSIETFDLQGFIASEIFRGLEPDSYMSVSDWADAYRTLSSKSAAEPGRWRTKRTPYLKEIMDCLSPRSPIQKVVFMKGAQIGGTECGNNWIGYIIHKAPGPIMAISPTVEMAKRNSRQRIDPLIEDCPTLKNLVSSARSRDKGNTMLSKDFKGGVLVMTGANSAVGLRSMPARYLFMDEIDGYPADIEGEGDPILLAERRTATFNTKKKIFLVSTPTIKGVSAIEREFSHSDQRFYKLPCPFCGGFQALKWEQIRPQENGIVFYECEHCHKLIAEHYKTQMLEAGHWEATSESIDGLTAGFHLSSLYSPVGWLSWAECVQVYEKAKKDATLMQGFRNTILGETYEQESEAPEWQRLYETRENYPMGVVPRDGLFLTAGVDIQKNRIECEVVAWGRQKQSWSVDYYVLDGDTAKPEVWAKLADVVNKDYPHESGITMPIRVMCVDSGYATQDVYSFVRQFNQAVWGGNGARANAPRTVVAIKGQSRDTAMILSTLKADTKKKGLKVWNVSGPVIKTELYRWLKMERVGEDASQFGRCHFPAYAEEYFKQLTAERQIVKVTNGYPKSVWEKDPTRRNEALDCRVYARAGAAIYGLDRIDLEYFKDVRKEFTVQEWLDVILGAIDYNAGGYENEDQKRSMITRLLPFVEKRINLIELAPKGTGKSYLFGGVSRFGYLASGVMSRSKLFFDLSRRTKGLVYNYDYVAFDEIQKLAFVNSDEISSTLKGYMEQGTISFGGHEGSADAGIILLGNIMQENMDEYKNMFVDLPTVFKESALLDRFHGFIRGWDIPRMHDDLKISGWALNSEYFCTMLHLLREDASYRAIVDQILEVPERADTRDTEAIKRIATGYLKLLFPHVRSPKDINSLEFTKYCLRPATKMRQIIKMQLGILDTEYKGKDVPTLTVRSEYGN